MWRRLLTTRHAAGHRLLAGALLGAAAERGCHDCHCEGAPGHELETSDSSVGASLISATAGLSVVAAAAPALCAVHCAAMPFVAVALPSLQLGGGVCMHGVARWIALYFVVPLGLVSNAFTYPQHRNPAITASSLLGVSCMTAAATVKRLSPHRNALNGLGCALMLGATYVTRQLEEEAGGCQHCSDCAASVPAGEVDESHANATMLVAEQEVGSSAKNDGAGCEDGCGC